MMSLTFDPFAYVSEEGPHHPLVYLQGIDPNENLKRKKCFHCRVISHGDLSIHLLKLVATDFYISTGNRTAESSTGIPARNPEVTTRC